MSHSSLDSRNNGAPSALTSYWIEFGDWPGDDAQRRIPPLPRAAGVTARSLREACEYIRRGFYEVGELPPIVGVHEGVVEAPGWWAPFAPAPSGEAGIWYPEPLFPGRTTVTRSPVPDGWPPVPTRRQSLTLFLAQDDLEALGAAIVVRRPTVRFRADGSREVLRDLPVGATTIIQIGDASLHPGYDEVPPDLLGALEFRLDAPLVAGSELRSSELVIESRTDDPNVVSFVTDVLDAAKQVTAARLERLSGLRENSKMRIGMSAEAWLRGAEERGLRHRSSAALAYRVRNSVNR